VDFTIGPIVTHATLAVHVAGALGPMFGRLTCDINKRYLAYEAAGLKQRSEGTTLDRWVTITSG